METPARSCSQVNRGKTALRGDGRGIPFQHGDAGCEAADNVFNICDFCITRGHCLGKRLDEIFESGYTLHD